MLVCSLVYIVCVQFFVVFVIYCVLSVLYVVSLCKVPINLNTLNLEECVMCACEVVCLILAYC